MNKDGLAVKTWLKAALRRRFWWVKEARQEIERWRFRLERARDGRGARRQDRPNVILLSMDSVGAKHLGCYGYGRPTSPHLDRLGASGVLFERVITQANWTKPALASMLTSLCPSVHKTDSAGEAGDRVDVRETQQANVLSDRFQTMAQKFKEGGYATAGLSDGGYAHSFFGFARGFDVYDDAAGGVKSCFYRLLRWLLRNREAPFFAFVHCWDAHYPYLDRPPYNRLFVRRHRQLMLDGRTRSEIHRGQRRLTGDETEFLQGLFDGSIRYIDDQVGEFLRELERLGLLDNTILAVTADHGEAFMEHNAIEHTECLYDEVLRVPLILRGPGVPAGRRVTAQARSIDIMPTLLELCRLPRPEAIQGTSLVPWLSGGSRDPLAAVSETERGGGLKAVADGRFKLIRKEATQQVELYDLLADPEERVDLSGIRIDVRARLESRLLSWEQETAELGRRLWSGESSEREEVSPEVIRRLQDLGYLE